MKIKYEDQWYTLDLQEMTLDDAKAMEDVGIPNLKELEAGISTGDLNALTVAFWQMQKQSGQDVELLKVRFKPLKFLVACAEASQAEQAQRPKARAPRSTR